MVGGKIQGHRHQRLSLGWRNAQLGPCPPLTTLNTPDQCDSGNNPTWKGPGYHSLVLVGGSPFCSHISLSLSAGFPSTSLQPAQAPKSAFSLFLAPFYLWKVLVSSIGGLAILIILQIPQPGHYICFWVLQWNGKEEEKDLEKICICFSRGEYQGFPLFRCQIKSWTQKLVTSDFRVCICTWKTVSIRG